LHRAGRYIPLRKKKGGGSMRMPMYQLIAENENNSAYIKLEYEIYSTYSFDPNSSLPKQGMEKSAV